MRKWLVLATWCCLVAIHGTARSAPWSPLEIDVWEPPFNTTHQRTQQQYTALTKAAKAWRLCVAIPHLKDAYWLAVNFALIDEARRLGIALDIVEAGGYEHLDVQRQQVSGCMQQGYDALIIGAVSATGLNDLIAKAVAERRPVIDLINGIDSPQITARVAADFYDLGSAVGRYIRAQPANPARPVAVAWLPGPQGAGWVAAGDRGFRDSLKGASVSIVDTRYGDTGFAAQGSLIKDILARHPDVDYIVGTAVTAEAAVQYLRKVKNKHAKVLAYYFGPAVNRGIRRGTILAAPSDREVMQARLAVDVAVRALEHKPYPRHAAVPVVMVDAAGYRHFDQWSSVAPPGFRPIFSTN